MEENTKFYDVRRPPFSVHGLYEPTRKGAFRRLPDEIAERTNEGVARQNHYPAGGRVRFSTDASYLIVRATGIGAKHYSNITPICGAGFDLYVDQPQVGGRTPHSTFMLPVIPPEDFAKGEYEVKINLPKGMHAYTLNLPLFNTLEGLYLGVNEDATVSAGIPYENKKPIVFYGSSITHGAAASRPGMAYTSIVSRRLNADYINLGFGGSAKGETVMAEYIASLDMCCFVQDYDYNAPSVEHLRATHYPLYKAVRDAHPDIPILLMSRPSFNTYHSRGGLRTEESIDRRDVIIDTFRAARAAGDNLVYYIDGESFFSGPDETECTVDGVHPNDLGMMKMADNVHRTVLRILNDVPFLKGV